MSSQKCVLKDLEAQRCGDSSPSYGHMINSATSISRTKDFHHKTTIYSIEKENNNRVWLRKDIGIRDTNKFLKPKGNQD